MLFVRFFTGLLLLLSLNIAYATEYQITNGSSSSKISFNNKNCSSSASGFLKNILSEKMYNSGQVYAGTSGNNIKFYFKYPSNNANGSYKAKFKIYKGSSLYTQSNYTSILKVTGGTKYFTSTSSYDGNYYVVIELTDSSNSNNKCIFVNNSNAIKINKVVAPTIPSVSSKGVNPNPVKAGQPITVFLKFNANVPSGYLVKSDILGLYKPLGGGLKNFSKGYTASSSTGSKTVRFKLYNGSTFVKNLGSSTYTIEQSTLNPPSGVSASDDTYTDKVKVSWNSVSGATKYQLYRSQYASSNFNYLDETSSTSFNDTTATAGITYYYKVKSYSSSTGSSNYSSADNGRRKELTTNTPKVISVSPLEVKKGISQVYFIKGENLTSNILGNIEGSVSHCSFVSINELGVKLECRADVIGNKRFYLKINGTPIADSQNIYINVTANSVPVTINPPTGVNASDGTYTDKVDVSWNSVSGATKYQLYRSQSSNSNFNFLAETSSTSFNDTTGIVGITYYYKVKSYNSSVGSSNYSSADSGYRKNATTTTPKVLSVSPLTVEKGIFQDYIIKGENLPNSIIGNIEGSEGHCSYVSSNENGVTLRCKASLVGNKRFYIKEADGTSISGAEGRYITVTDNSSVGTLPTQILSPVKGALVLASGSSSKWAFNQHKTGVHKANKGIGNADDTYAWDINLNYPSYDSDNGKPVYAVDSGIVSQTYGGMLNTNGTLGQVLIEHSNGSKKWWSGYLHMKNIQVSKGSVVTKNTVIGYISNVGVPKNGNGVKPNHLHFSVYSGENKFGKLKSFNLSIQERSGGSQTNKPILSLVEGIDFGNSPSRSLKLRDKAIIRLNVSNAHTVQVNFDNQGDYEVSKSIGSDGTYNFEYQFNKIDYTSESTDFWKKDNIRFTATAYGTGGLSKLIVSQPFTIYDVGEWRAWKAKVDAKALEAERKRKEEEKKQLEAENNSKKALQNNITTSIENTIDSYVDAVQQDMASYGEIPDGLIKDDCLWREKGKCVSIYPDYASHAYGYGKKSEDYSKYPFTLYVKYQFNQEGNSLYDIPSPYPAEVWVEFHTPKNILETFNHNVSNPKSFYHVMVPNSKVLEAQAEAFIETAKYEIDKSNGVTTDLYFKTRDKLKDTVTITYEELDREISSIKEVIAQMELGHDEEMFALSLAVDMTPLISTSKSLSQLALGKEWFTTETVSRVGESVNVVLSIYPPAKIARIAKKHGKKVSRGKEILKTIFYYRKIGKKAEKLLKVNSRLTKEFGVLYSKVSEHKGLSYIATVIEKGKKVKKRRYFDLISSKGVAIESKVGNPKLYIFTKLQIQKDIDALRKGHVKKVIWISNKSPVTNKTGFDNNFIEYAKDLLKKNNLSENLLEFRGKNYTPPYLSPELIK